MQVAPGERVRERETVVYTVVYRYMYTFVCCDVIAKACVHGQNAAMMNFSLNRAHCCLQHRLFFFVVELSLT